MPIKNPNTPYERAYNAWSYGGGQQRGEPMPRARDFPSSDSGSENDSQGWQPGAPAQAPYGQGWQPQAPYQGPGSFSPLDQPPDQGPIGQPPWMRETDRRRDLPTGGRRYTAQEKRAIQAQYGDVRGREQQRFAESPAVVQRARAYEQRRRQPHAALTSLGALNTPYRQTRPRSRR